MFAISYKTLIFFPDFLISRDDNDDGDDEDVDEMRTANVCRRKSLVRNGEEPVALICRVIRYKLRINIYIYSINVKVAAWLLFLTAAAPNVLSSTGSE